MSLHHRCKGNDVGKSCNGVILPSANCFFHIILPVVTDFMYCFNAVGVSLSSRTKVGSHPAFFSLVCMAVKAYNRCCCDLDSKGCASMTLLP